LKGFISTIAFFAVALAVIPVADIASADAPKPRYVINTGDAPGFSDGDAIYTIGMEQAAFTDRFGAPKATQPSEATEGEEAETWLYYSDRGIIAVVRGGKVALLRFWMVDFDPHDKEVGIIRAADAKTDKGIGPKASQQDVRRAHGKPMKLDGMMPVNIDYIFPWGCFTFTAREGLLCIDVEDRRKPATQPSTAPHQTLPSE
jgi:hypothetical protein